MNKIWKIGIGIALIVSVCLGIYNVMINGIISSVETSVNKLFETELKTYKQYSKEDHVDESIKQIVNISCNQEKPLVLSPRHESPAVIEIKNIFFKNMPEADHPYVELTYDVKILKAKENNNSYILKYLILNENDGIMQIGTFNPIFDSLNESVSQKESLTNLNNLHHYKFMFVE